MDQATLDAIPDLSSPPIVELPMGIDPIPYGQWGLQGRYPRQVMPDTIPPVYSVLGATDANFNPDTLSTDGKRNLNVNIAAGGGGGGGGLSPQKWRGSGNQIMDLTVANGSSLTISSDTGSYLLGAVVSMAPDTGATPTGSGIVMFTMVNFSNPTGTWMPIAAFMVNVTASAQSTCQSAQVMFPVPVDNSTFNYSGFRVYNNLNYNIQVACHIIGL